MMTPAEIMRKLMDEINGVPAPTEEPVSNHASPGKHGMLCELEDKYGIYGKPAKVRKTKQGSNDSPLTYGGTEKWKNEKDFFKKYFSRPFLTKIREWINIVERREAEYSLKTGASISVKMDSSHNEDDDDIYTVTAWVDGKEIGSARYNAESSEVEKVWVDPDFRRQGVAMVMYDHLSDNRFRVAPSSALSPDGEAFWKTRLKMR